MRRMYVTIGKWGKDFYDTEQVSIGSSTNMLTFRKQFFSNLLQASMGRRKPYRGLHAACGMQLALPTLNILISQK